MKLNRIGRIVVCLLLICCLTYHAMIPRAEASSIGAAATIVKASTVTCNPYIIAGATLIALGVYAGVETGAFETVANNCVSALETAGTWIKDGAMELLRTEDADGNASYYVDSGLMEDVRSWVFDAGILTTSLEPPTDLCPISGINPGFEATLSRAREFPYYVVAYTTTGHWLISWDDHPFRAVSEDHPTLGLCYTIYSTISGATPYYWRCDFTNTTKSNGTGHRVYSYTFYETGVNDNYFADCDVALGVLPSASSDLTDGTSARQWSEDYTDRGLKVYGGGSGNNNNDGKWFWPLALTLTAAELYAMSQADQWAAQTPAEFDDYTEVEELEIVSRPEVDFAQGVELAPVTSPTPDTGGNTGSDTGTESGNQTDYTSWFQKIIKGIEELPSKFADWFNNIAEKLERIGEQIQTLGQTIVEGIKNVLSELFSPSEDFLMNQVEALKAKHHNIDNFINLGNELKAFFAGLGSTPPIIYIDLGAATGSYLWGGRQIFLDLTWYSEYKSKMDFILGGIIWLWLAWRVFLSIPGIINGESGTWGARNEHADTYYVSGPLVTDQKMLTSGRGSRRFRK